MGLRYPQVTSLLETAIKQEIDESIESLTMIEFGEQNMTGVKKGMLAKQYFESMGYNHTSLDLVFDRNYRAYSSRG